MHAIKVEMLVSVGVSIHFCFHGFLIWYIIHFTCNGAKNKQEIN